MEMNYASRSVANAGLATGIVGTALGIMSGGAGLLGAHNGINNNNGYVSKEAYEIQLKLIDAQKDNAILQADLDSEKKMVQVFNATNDKINAVRDELKTEIRGVEMKVDENAAAQGVINSQLTSQVGINTSQIAQLFSMTKLVIPNGSVCPGWGAVSVAPSGCTTCGTTIA